MAAAHWPDALEREPRNQRTRACCTVQRRDRVDGSGRVDRSETTCVLPLVVLRKRKLRIERAGRWEIRPVENLYDLPADLQIVAFLHAEVAADIEVLLRFAPAPEIRVQRADSRANASRGDL